MTDTTITDSYITLISLVDAFFANDPRATAFVALAAGPKSWYLQKATKVIDSLPYKGQTYYTYNPNAATLDSDEQARVFPRLIGGRVHDWDDDADGPIVPKNVKNACCEEAFAIYDTLISPDKKMRLALQRQGVVSANYSGTSETFAQNPSGSISGAGNRYKGLMSKEAYDYLKPYIAGAVPSAFSANAYREEAPLFTR
jgi:hypothetical protein